MCCTVTKGEGEEDQGTESSEEEEQSRRVSDEGHLGTHPKELHREMRDGTNNEKGKEQERGGGRYTCTLWQADVISPTPYIT
jgi:hypothetical protein